MVLGFETSNLRALCEDEKNAQGELGDDASHLLALLADLDSAPTLADLPSGMLQPIDQAAQLFLIENGPIRLSFVVNQRKFPLNESGELVLSKVMRVKVIGVEHV